MMVFLEGFPKKSGTNTTAKIIIIYGTAVKIIIIYVSMVRL